MEEPHAEAQKLVEAVKASQHAVRAAKEASATRYEQALGAFVSKEVAAAGAIADLSDEQRGYIKGFALGLIVCGELPSSSADRVVAPIFGDDFFANRTTTVRISGSSSETVAGYDTDPGGSPEPGSPSGE